MDKATVKKLIELVDRVAECEAAIAQLREQEEQQRRLKSELEKEIRRLKSGLVWGSVGVTQVSFAGKVYVIDHETHETRAVVTLSNPTPIDLDEEPCQPKP